MYGHKTLCTNRSAGEMFYIVTPHLEGIGYRMKALK